MSHNQRIGKWGEQAAAAYLTQKGYTILATNLRTPHGEIDILASREGLPVFVEVKTRTSNSFGLPEEGLTRRKLAHMRASAAYYAAQNELDTWQCDAIAIQGHPGAEFSIEHFENVTA